jgi:hypothetical protein
MGQVNIPPEDRFSRALFGVILVTAVFYSAGKWVAFGLGILFLLSASQGFCWTCHLHRKFFQRKCCQK